jgi:hypothetical protein
LPLLVVNDFSRDPGVMIWGWELLFGGQSVAQGGGEAEIPKDSAVGIGEAEATLYGSRPAVLSLRLSSRGGSASNE